MFKNEYRRRKLFRRRAIHANSLGLAFNDMYVLPSVRQVPAILPPPPMPALPAPIQFLPVNMANVGIRVVGPNMEGNAINPRQFINNLVNWPPPRGQNPPPDILQLLRAYQRPPNPNNNNNNRNPNQNRN